MKPTFIAALILAGTAAAAQGSVLVVGGGMAESCYQAAEAGDRSHSALQLCNRALVEEPLGKDDRVATYVNRGILHFGRGSRKEAASDFDKALGLDPTEPDAWLNKAVLTVQSGNEIEALPMVEKALELGSRRPALAYFVRGLIEEHRGNLRSAYEDFRHAQRLEPKWRQPGIELARYQVRRK